MHVLGLAVDSGAVVTGHQEGTGNGNRNATRLTSLTSAVRRMLGTGARLLALRTDPLQQQTIRTMAIRLAAVLQLVRVAMPTTATVS